MEIYGETFNNQSADLLQGMQIQLLLTVRGDIYPLPIYPYPAFTIVAQKCFYWGKECLKKKKSRLPYVHLRRESTESTPGATQSEDHMGRCTHSIAKRILWLRHLLKQN